MDIVTQPYNIAYGGGAVYIEARSADIEGSIRSNGEDGYSHYSGQSNCSYGRYMSAGASGGMIWLNVQNLNLQGSLSVKGGYGGHYCTSDGHPDQGGGGGGRVTIQTESLIDTTLINLSGGSGGTYGNQSSQPGMPGEDGVLFYLKTHVR